MDVEKTFAHHTPSEESLLAIKKLRRSFADLGRTITSLCPAGKRETAAAVTKLEECAMWAIKSVAVNDPESVIDWSEG